MRENSSYSTKGAIFMIFLPPMVSMVHECKSSSDTGCHRQGMMSHLFSSGQRVHTNTHFHIFSEPEAASEESPSTEEEQGASSAAASEPQEPKSTGEIEPAENGEKTEGVTEEKKGDGKEKRE